MKKIFYSVFLVLAFMVVPFPGRSQQIALIIVTNAQTSVSKISVKELADYYLKKKRSWPDGTPVRPIDWIEGQPARRFFLKNVLNKTESELAQYWMGQKLYTGDKPPMSLDSESTICSLVSTIKGSIGYFLASSESVKSCTGIKVIGEVY